MERGWCSTPGCPGLCGPHQPGAGEAKPAATWERGRGHVQQMCRTQTGCRQHEPSTVLVRGSWAAGQGLACSVPQLPVTYQRVLHQRDTFAQLQNTAAMSEGVTGR